MSPEEIATESKELWSKTFSEVNWTDHYSADFPHLIDAKEIIAQCEVRQELQPWLHILEDSIQWLAILTRTLDESNQKEQLDDAGRSILALVGASCAHSVAIRKLVLAGLDGPARAAVRSLDEHLCAALAFLHDRELGQNFQRCSTDDEIAAFWFKNLNTRAMKKYLNAIERKAGIPQVASDGMRNWRDDEINDFSKTVHPSYLGAMLTAYTLGAKDPGTYGLAMLGKASCFSERTLRYACKSIYYFSLVGFRELFGIGDCSSPIVVFDKNTSDHQFAIIGANVLQTLGKKYWSYQIYPNSDQEPEGQFRESSSTYMTR